MKKTLINIIFIISLIFSMCCGSSGGNKKKIVENNTNPTTNNIENFNENLFKNKAPEGLNYSNVKTTIINLTKFSSKSISKYRYIKISLDSQFKETVYLGKLNHNKIEITTPLMKQQIYYQIYGESEDTQNGIIPLGEVK
jgi:hypothetical protein